MTDFLTPLQRSERMSRIRGRNTKPELKLRKALHALGLRYRLHDVSLPGSPDLKFSRSKIVVFVHGCFWHRHKGCKVASVPKSNKTFWTEKFRRNITRDILVKKKLKKLGWTVLIVWECELGTKAKTVATVARISQKIRP
jgi:DNA mismatch endonuclease (patch repair protein)